MSEQIYQARLASQIEFFKSLDFNALAVAVRDGCMERDEATSILAHRLTVNDRRAWLKANKTKRDEFPRRLDDRIAEFTI